MKKPENNSRELDLIANRIREQLGEKDLARETCLKSCREIVRLSSTAIRAVHRGEKGDAKETINAAAMLVARIKKQFKTKNPDLLYANYVHDSFKEFAEASITYGIIFENEVPDPELLGVAYPAYLNGLAEAVGELRRYILDGLRTGNYSPAENLLAMMDQIYSLLVTMDFPDAITYGLRRNTDNVRGIVEKTRGDLTMVIHNDLLQKKIGILTGKLGNSTDQI
jgi:translin